MIYTFTIPATLAFDVEAASEAEAHEKAGKQITSGMEVDDLLRLLDPYVRVADDAEISLEESYCRECGEPNGCVCEGAGMREG